MLERCACGLTGVLEDQDVLESFVLPEVDDAIAISPEHIFNALFRHRGQRGEVVGRLDDDLVRADAVHLVEHSLGLPVQVPFNAERGELVGYDANRPALRIGAARPTVLRRTVSKNLRWCLVLIAVAERT